MDFRTQTQILLDMIQHGQKIGLLESSQDLPSQVEQGNYKENQYILNLATHAYSEEQLEQKIREVYENINIDTMDGASLDNIGDLFNVSRIPFLPAIVTITVSTPTPSEENITIPAGTQLIIDPIVSKDAYVTSTDSTLNAGVSSIQIQCESATPGVTSKLQIGSVTGLQGYPTLTVTNTEEGSLGTDIEGDNSYRERVKSWASKNERGSRPMIEAYLSSYPGVNDFKLIPLYAGVGTLKVVVDTSISMGTLAQDIYDDCMSVTDEMPLVVGPTLHSLESMYVHIAPHSDTALTMTMSELLSLVKQQVAHFISGGIIRDGTRVPGLRIGESFISSQLTRFLLEQIPELENVVISYDGDVTNNIIQVDVNSDEKFVCNLIVGVEIS